MNLKEKFENEKDYRTYRRIDDKHIYDWFVGYSEIGNKCIVLINNGKYIKFESTKFIRTNFEKRVDGKFILSFELIDSKYSDIYIKFCEDLIETSRSQRVGDIFEFILMRWNMWKSIFKNMLERILTENEIKGLIGELIYLKKFMFKQYGIEAGINAWQGPINLHKDFEIQDTWYEIKTTNDNSLTVTISSSQQLEDLNPGQLVIIRLTNTNESVNDSITLNKLISEINLMIENKKINELYWSKLNYIGYMYNEEYNKYNYKLYSITRYDTSKTSFPKIISKELKDGISNVSYEILINRIEQYKIKE